MADLLRVPDITNFSAPSEILLYKIYWQLINGFSLIGTEDNITAHAGGGQASAYLLTKQFSNITTVATTGDSVKTLNALISFQYSIRNSGANTCTVYPATGERFDGLAVNEGYDLEAGGQILLTCVAQGIWKIN